METINRNAGACYPPFGDVLRVVETRGNGAPDPARAARGAAVPDVPAKPARWMAGHQWRG